MKQIILRAEVPLYNYVDIQVIDLANDGSERLRCKVTCEFAKYDVSELQKRGLSLEDALDYYCDWLFNVVKVHLASDWEIMPSHEDEYKKILSIISENVARFY